MTSEVEQVKTQQVEAQQVEAQQVGGPETVKRFAIQHPITAYTFPTELIIHDVQIDDDHLHLDLTDGRKLSIPLWWIPTVHHADPAEREKFEINQSRTMIIWDPNKCAINDEIRVADYMGPYQG